MLFSLRSNLLSITKMISQQIELTGTYRIRQCEQIGSFQDRRGDRLGKVRLFAVRLYAHIPQIVVHLFENRARRILRRFVIEGTTSLFIHFPLSNDINEFSCGRAYPELVMFVLAGESHPLHRRRPLTWRLWGRSSGRRSRSASNHDTVIRQLCANMGCRGT